MEFKGVVTDVQDKSGTSKKGEPFTAYQIVVEEQTDRYPQSGVFDIFGDRVDVPAIGDEVNVHFSLQANEWQGKYYGKNNVWKIEVLGAGQSAPQQTMPPVQQVSPMGQAPSEGDGSGLPF